MNNATIHPHSTTADRLEQRIAELGLANLPPTGIAGLLRYVREHDSATADITRHALDVEVESELGKVLVSLSLELGGGDCT